MYACTNRRPNETIILYKCNNVNCHLWESKNLILILQLSIFVVVKIKRISAKGSHIRRNYLHLRWKSLHKTSWINISCKPKQPRDSNYFTFIFVVPKKMLSIMHLVILKIYSWIKKKQKKKFYSLQWKCKTKIFYKGNTNS